MLDFVSDLAHSLRLARKAPGFTLLAVTCLGLGIGVNTAVFSMLNYLFFRPLPVAAPDRLVVLGRAANQLLSWPEYRDLRDRARLFTGLAASNPTESSLEFDGETHSAAAEAVSPNYAQVIGVRPFLGRWFRRDDEPAAVIGYRTWQRLFHADPHILGKRVRSETQWYTIVGVAPPEFAGIYLPLNMDIWVPFRTWAAHYPGLAAELEDRARPRVFVFGRMQPGIAPTQAAAELNSIAAQVKAQAQAAPLTVERVRGIPNARSRSTSVPVAAVLMAVVGVVLLIACVNVGNLLLARGAARAREISLRLALGARRTRIVRQLVTENLALAAGGGLVGMLLGAWTARFLEVLMPTTAFGESLRLDLTPDARVMIGTMLLALATTLVFGLAPAWRASRSDVLPALKGETPAPRFGLRRVSLVAQVSLSLMLLLTAGLFLRVLLTFRNTDPGFAVNNRTYITTLASAPEFTPETARQWYAHTVDSLRALPGVSSAATTNLLPLTPINPDCVSEPGHDSQPATTSTVSPGYLRTMRIPLVMGRDFSAADRPGGLPVAIVNQTLAARLWPGRPAIGKRLLLGCHDPVSLEVVGVARDARVVSLGQAPQPHIYRAFAQDSDGVENIVVETASGAGPLPELLHKTVSAGGPGARIYGVRPLRKWIDRSYWQVRWEACLLGAFGGLAVLLAALGLYGAIAYHVNLRTREIGIRMAIGAQPADVRRMVLRQGLALTAVGVGVGLALSVVVARALARLLYGVSPTDLPTYLSVSLVWLAVAATACYLPARRAARVDPAVALRYE
jgi:predicted permease